MKNKLFLSVFILILFSFFNFGKTIIKAPDFSKGLETNYKWAKNIIYPSLRMCFFSRRTRYGKQQI